MSSFLTRVFLLSLPLGGLGGAIAFTSTYSGLGRKQIVVAPRRVWPKDYKNDCYKWIIQMSAGGELIICPKKTEPNSPLFYLWWIDNERNPFIPVKKIKELSGGSIKFEFKSRNQDQPEKVLALDWWKKNQRGNEENLKKIIGKDLESSCKMEEATLKCHSEGYNSGKLDLSPFYF